MKVALEKIGFYRSGPGGAPQPFMVQGRRIYFELITEGAVYIPGGKTLQGTGTVFVHQEGQFTVFRTQGRSHYACLTASFLQSRGHAKVDWPRFFEWDDVGEARGFARKMLRSYHQDGVGLELLGDLLWSQFRYQMDCFVRRSKIRGIPSRLAAVLAKIERSFQEPMGVADLAAAVGLSASHLHAEFRQHLGVSPHQKIIQQRMRVARHLLATTTDPIKAVADAAGYANTENFCRAFRKQTGLTAAAYRAKFQIFGQ